MPDNDDTREPAKAEENEAEQAEPVAEATALAQPENRRARRAAAATTRRQGGSPAEREGARRRAVETGLDAGERVDDALARGTDRAVRFLKRNFNVLQWIIVGGAAAWIGWEIYSWRTDKVGAKVADLMADALSAEQGRVGEPDEQGTKKDPRGALDTRRVFKTDADRIQAAQQAYEKVSAERPGTPASALAKLGLAGVLYDQGKYAEAMKLYEETLASDLAKLDPESKGRSLESIGLCLEGKGDPDAALKRYGELENADIPGFRELALYHQARLLNTKGDKEGAKERLKKVVEKLSKETSATEGPSYLLGSARDLLQRIDPSALPKDSPDEALRKALEEVRKKLPAGVTQVPMPVPQSP